jgi:polyisoprenoid-binding protein YceI
VGGLGRTIGREATEKEAAMGTWQLDPYHTQVEFSAKHLGMMTVRGNFTEVSATSDIDPAHPESASVEVTIQAASVRTHNDIRDNDLRGSNFFDVDEFPTITFKSTGVEVLAADRYRLAGDLTVKGTTLPVSLEVQNYGEFNDEKMGHRIGYSASTKISRKDFGLGFNMMLDGRWVVSDEIKVEIEGELVEQGEPAETTGE